MASTPYNLAIETTSRQGSIALGCGDQLLATAQLQPKHRHNIELIPAIADLCPRHGLAPDALGEIYVALGPGSFTGLRVALASVKMLALARSLRVVGVPSLDALAHNVPRAFEHAAVCLNLKRGTVHSAVFSRDAHGFMQLASEPALRTLGDLLEDAPRPLALIGDPLPEDAAVLDDPAVTVLTGDVAHCSARAVWEIGRRRAKDNRFDDPATLTPAYAREPEAVTLWKQRHPASR